MTSTVQPTRPRVLVVGRSPGVLEDAVDLLRSKGYRADATNVYGRLLDDYDVARLDLLVFGGMVPPDAKQQLRDEISRRNERVRFVQGLAGIPGVIAAQVEQAVAGEPDDRCRVTYDAQERSFVLDLDVDKPVTVVLDAFWATGFTPPEPTSTQAQVFAGQLGRGRHVIPLPDAVPTRAAFAAVTVGPHVEVLTVGATPSGVAQLVAPPSPDGRFPDVRAVTTRGGLDA
ncbi:hypothetical protein [Cellulomonas sp.]|uniref:hypothetical protein n=1 Tax=Cellulomonas sp. TaxID=40001 RepID=UPI001B2E0369|nr:hypothetical protein [Cellulomonas sp.]MBO9553574.1 hypothetical protein [Cellulomonas sp.]